MDSLESARQVAALLRRSLIDAGHDPIDLYALARAEATRRDIDVERVPKGDVRLRGGRALFDPQAFLILHENHGTPFDQAFLIAHEVGHVELGGHTQPDLAFQVDPLGTPPLGVDRIAGYSRLERRELQMDLFAREFLLPRSWLGDLYLAGGESAASLAQRLGAPFAVIAQQLFDALLLPPVAAEEEQGPVTELDEDQAEAARHRGAPYLLEAGPGTGKTKTLVARVQGLVQEGVAPERILVLTFSNKAAHEFSSRLSRTLPTEGLRIWAGTFHAFGLDLIRRFHRELGFPSEPQLLDRSDAVELLEREILQLGLQHFLDLRDPSRLLMDVLQAISRASDEVADVATFQKLARAMLANARSDEAIKEAQRQLEVGRVFEVYEELKRARGLVDFGDLVAMPVRLCESMPEVRSQLETEFEHVLVDEFQDVNRSSVRILNAITQGGKNLWAVGDAKQSIYRFRGASSFNLARFGDQDFPGGVRGRLGNNYRSTSAIIGSFVQFAKHMRVAQGRPASLEGRRGIPGHRPQYRKIESPASEAWAIAEAIHEMREAGHAYRTQAVLCSGNDRLAALAQGLEQLNIPVLYLGSLFEREEIKDLLAMLSIAVDRRAMGLLRLATLEGFEASLADVACILAHLKDHSPGSLEWMTTRDQIGGLSPEGANWLSQVARCYAGFTKSQNPWDLLAQILLDRTSWIRSRASSSSVRSRAECVAAWQLMNFLLKQPRAQGLPISRVLDRIRRLVALSDERDLRQLPTAAQGIDAVRLMTMHGSKGLEFDVVHIPGMSKNTLPRSAAVVLAKGVLPPDGLIEGASGSGLAAAERATEEEQECLFFVALSRAKERLFLYSVTKNANGAARPTSPFLDLLQGTLDYVDPQVVGPSLDVFDNLGHIPVRFTTPLSLTDHQLLLYQRCPRRFFYTHILEVGGKRIESRFTLVQNAVREAIQACEDTTPVDLPAALRRRVGELLTEQGLNDARDGGHYEQLSRTLVDRYLKRLVGVTRLPAAELRLSLPGGGELSFRADLVLQEASGRTRVCQVNMGAQRTSDLDGFWAAAFEQAAQQAYPDAVCELIYLSDDQSRLVEFTEKVRANRLAKLVEIVENIRAGQFPIRETPSCPRCPAFFICGKIPDGEILLEKSP